MHVCVLSDPIDVFKETDWKRPKKHEVKAGTSLQPIKTLFFSQVRSSSEVSQVRQKFVRSSSDVRISVFPQLLPFDFHATLASELSKSQFYTSFWRLTLILCEGAAPGPTKFTFCHMFGCPTCAISADGCPCPKEIHIPPHAWAFETHDLRRRLLRAKKFRISPHHMLAHPTCTISAEGCPRTNKTRISPHVWVSDTPQFWLLIRTPAQASDEFDELLTNFWDELDELLTNLWRTSDKFLTNLTNFWRTSDELLTNFWRTWRTSDELDEPDKLFTNFWRTWRTSEIFRGTWWFFKKLQKTSS